MCVCLRVRVCVCVRVRAPMPCALTEEGIGSPGTMILGCSVAVESDLAALEEPPTPEMLAF